MKTHLARAQHNEKFLDFIETNINDDFLDWKITVAFYAALHYLKAFLKLKGIISGNSHKEIDSIIDPKNPKAKFPIPEKQYTYYQELYQNARNSRYSGLYTSDFQILLLKVKCDQSKKSLEELKSYFKENGLKF